MSTSFVRIFKTNLNQIQPHRIQTIDFKSQRRSTNTTVLKLVSQTTKIKYLNSTWRDYLFTSDQQTDRKIERMSNFIMIIVIEIIIDFSLSHCDKKICGQFSILIDIIVYSSINEDVPVILIMSQVMKVPLCENFGIQCTFFR